MVLADFPFCRLFMMFSQRTHAGFTHAVESDHMAEIKHVGIIMDGNGRWGTRQGCSRSEGHSKGAETAFRLVQHVARSRSVAALTLYAFSIENWRRPKQETDFLMMLLGEWVLRHREDFVREQVRFFPIGQLEGLPDSTRMQLLEVREATMSCRGLKLALAVNYSGQAEVIDAIARASRQLGSVDHLEPSAIDRYMTTQPLGPVDAIMRTGGEKRLSNFLLWQAAYAELMFIDTLWPDFTPTEFESLLSDLSFRDRKFGAV